MMASTFNQDRLSRAAEDGNERVVKLLLETSTVQVNLHDDDGSTPLFRAAKNGHEATVKTLLTAQADVNAQTDNQLTPLHAASQGGHTRVVELLLEIGNVEVDLKDRYGQTPLSKAARSGHDAVVKLLLETGKVQGDSMDRYGQTPLSKAARSGHDAVVKLLLETGKVQGDSKDNYGQTPFSKAVSHGHEATMQLLLANSEVEVDSEDFYGETPLLKAAAKGHEAVVQLLLAKSQVDVNWKDKDGRSPLSWAAEKGHEAVVQLLLAKSQVDVNWKDKDGRSPLSWAVEKGHKAVVRLLLEIGQADISLSDADDQTPNSNVSGNLPGIRVPKTFRDFIPTLEAFAKPKLGILDIIHCTHLHLLRLLRPKPQFGYRRLEWLCSCGMPLYGDFRGNEKEIDKLVTEIQNVGFVVTQSGFGATRSPEGSEQPNLSSPVPVMSAIAAVSPETPNSFVNSSREFVRGMSNLRSSGINFTGTPSISTIADPKYVALCVKNGPFQTFYQEVDISSIPEDNQIFQRFQAAYEACRSSQINVIRSIFAQPVDIQYIQFAVEGFKHVYPIAGSPDCTICAQVEDRDDLITTRRYERHSALPAALTHPPVPPSLFFHLWECPRDISPAAQKMWLNRLPKKIDEKLEKACLRTRSNDEPVYGWGILVVDGIRKQRVSRLTAAIVAFAFAISLTYSVGKNDVSSGFAIGALVIGCWTVFVTVVYFELQGN